MFNSRSTSPAVRRSGPSRGTRVLAVAAWCFAPELVSLEGRTLLSTFTVKNDADSGTGSLRAAIAEASSGDTINFAPSAYGTITLTSGPLVVPNINLTIKGPGASKLTISGNDTYTVLELGVVPYDAQTPSSMTISGLTIANGNASVNDIGGSGGGIAEAVNLTLVNSVLTNNVAPNESGGGISNAFPDSGLDLTVVNDVFMNNTAGSAVDLLLPGEGRRDRRRRMVRTSP